MQQTTISTSGAGEPQLLPLSNRRGVTGFGFYLYLLTDCILFATLFATFAVLHTSVNNGPNGQELFSLKNAFIETAFLLTSSLTCGLAMLACDRRDQRAAMKCLALTFILGVAFLTLELKEFEHLLSEGAGPSRSAFLSSFYTLVSTHGLHVTAGLGWILILLLQMRERGLTEGILRRLFCFSLFWHVIDVVWIAVFSFVYLIGSGS